MLWPLKRIVSPRQFLWVAQHRATLNHKKVIVGKVVVDVSLCRPLHNVTYNNILKISYFALAHGRSVVSPGCLLCHIRAPPSVIAGLQEGSAVAKWLASGICNWLSRVRFQLAALFTMECPWARHSFLA